MLNKNDLKKLYILGPTGTNSELAAKTYIQEHKLSTEIILCKTLELGIVEVLKDKHSALLGCVAYPDLHNLIFPYLDELVIGDLFLCDTYDMVLAKKKDTINIQKVASHIAPSSLIDDTHTTMLCNSNADAAQLCFQDKTDACITTERAANDLGLEIIKNYNSLPMGFSVHIHRDILEDA